MTKVQSWAAAASLVGNLVMTPPAKASEVVVWSEHTELSSIYPQGIDGALAAQIDLITRRTGFDADDPGLTVEDLAGIDVLIWFGHRRHDDVPDALAQAIADAVRDRGMGFIALHSAHFSKPFRAVMGTSGAWKRYVEKAGPQRIHGLLLEHAIWAGLHDFTLPQGEMYVEPFDVPEPDAVVATSTWQGGFTNREVMTWQRGRGRVVYVATGHETYPIFQAPEMVRLVRNAIAWVRPS